MSQYTFTGSAGTIANLNQNFTQLYALRELIADASYTPAVSAISISAGGLVGINQPTPLVGLHIKGATSISGRCRVESPAGVVCETVANDIASAGSVGTITSHPLIFNTNSAARFSISTTGQMTPAADNGQDLGSGSFRMRTIYAGTGTINTSDAREKTAVDPLTPQEIDAARLLAREIGSFKFISSVAEKGAGARQHIGMTVQRAMDIMQDQGLDPWRYGFICFDEWPATEATDDTPATEAGSRFGFRTDELLLFIARGFEARLSALEGF